MAGNRPPYGYISRPSSVATEPRTITEEEYEMIRAAVTSHMKKSKSSVSSGVKAPVENADAKTGPGNGTKQPA